jgi:CheY-like chemotaxis protein
MPGEVFPPSSQRPRGATILIVEDDVDIGQFLQELIEEETPYSTVVIHDSLRALEQAPELHPCLLLLDYRLPGLDGLELYDRLQRFQQTRGVPAIMMSATLPVTELEQRGIYQLRKPMEIGNVLRMITHALASADERKLN